VRAPRQQSAFLTTNWKQDRADFNTAGLKKNGRKKLSQPSKTLGIKEGISQSYNENQRVDFFSSSSFFLTAAHITTVEL